MQRMRLFEVGFKAKPSDGSYSEKFHVAANTGEDAIEKGRAYLIEKTHEWWEDDGGKEDMTLDCYVEDKNADPDLSDAEILASPKYQKQAAQIFKRALKDANSMLLARVYDEGTLII